MKYKNADKLLFKILICICMITFSMVYAHAMSAVAHLSWDANTDPELTRYVVHYGIRSKSYQDTLDAGKNSAIEIEGLIPGQTYYFAVTACYGSFVSEYSDEVSITIPASAEPSNEVSLSVPASTQPTNEFSEPASGSTVPSQDSSNTLQAGDAGAGDGGNCFITTTTLAM
jgi:hypothetical protein